MEGLNSLAYLECGPAVASDASLIEHSKESFRLLEQEGEEQLEAENTTTLEIQPPDSESEQELDAISTASKPANADPPAPLHKEVLRDLRCEKNADLEEQGPQDVEHETQVTGVGWEEGNCANEEKQQEGIQTEVTGKADAADEGAETRYEEIWEILNTIEGLMKDSIGLPGSDLLTDCSQEELEGIPKDLLEALEVPPLKQETDQS